MVLKKPKSMDECVYYTCRDIGKKGEGEVTLWVFKKKCPKCRKDYIGKPRTPNGKVKTRAKEYVCAKCSYKVDKKDYEDSLMANIKYLCPSCKHKGELQVAFKRKNIGGALTLRFQCQKCGINIDVTRKMK